MLCRMTYLTTACTHQAAGADSGVKVPGLALVEGRRFPCCCCHSESDVQLNLSRLEQRFLQTVTAGQTCTPAASATSNLPAVLRPPETQRFGNNHATIAHGSDFAWIKESFVTYILTDQLRQYSI